MHFRHNQRGTQARPIKKRRRPIAINLGPLPEESSFDARIQNTGRFSYEEAPTGAVAAETMRESLYLQNNGSGLLPYQYDPDFTAILCKYYERYVNGTKDGSGNLITPDTTNDSDWDQSAGKMVQNGLDSCRSNWTRSPAHCNIWGMLNCYELGISPVAHAGNSPAESDPVAGDFSSARAANVGGVGFEENPRGSPGTYTDVNGDTRMEYYSDSAGLRRTAYMMERQIAAIHSGNSFVNATDECRIQGYGTASWQPNLPETQGTLGPRVTFAWPVEWIEGQLYELKGSYTDGRTPAYYQDDTEAKWEAVGNNDVNHRNAPWFTGLACMAMIRYMEMEVREGNDPHRFWLGDSGFSDFPDQLFDYLDWQISADFKVHSDSSTNADALMYDFDGTYKTFRQQDRSGSGGSTGFDDITMIMGAVYAWAGKQLALGNSDLGITQDITRAETYWDVFDNMFGHLNDNGGRDPFHNYSSGKLISLKELGELYNGALMGWFLRLEAQGIDTGREWI